MLLAYFSIEPRCSLTTPSSLDRVEGDSEASERLRARAATYGDFEHPYSDFFMDEVV